MPKSQHRPWWTTSARGTPGGGNAPGAVARLFFEPLPTPGEAKRFDKLGGRSDQPASEMCIPEKGALSKIGPHQEKLEPAVAFCPVRAIIGKLPRCGAWGSS